MRTEEVRERFLKFFEDRGHTRVRSSSLVPEGDPTLLFTNAGMNQFKAVFTGEEKRPYTRATSSQKCVRAGGKHNDLENVGFTARHHTFFEMLGNFSFGDYFKEEAIAFCWEHLTRDLALPPEKLWVTVYKDDDEAERIWKKVSGLPSRRILRFGEKDNFWSMGETGPCGPCSEIHFDQGVELTCGHPDCGVNCVSDQCDRYLEIWNNVFMQFDRDASGKLTPLPRPSIDTGMGLERITSILQGKKTNYEIDLFQGIIQTVAEVSKRKYGSSKETDASMRVIADHARATSFLIADGVLPSNEGRGYVLRRIMRRAIRHGVKLEVREPFLHEVAGRVIREMSSAFPELGEKADHIRKMAKLEEERFRQTLDTGLKLLSESMSKVKSAGGTRVPGEVAFKLHDTYGFPVDLTRVIAAEQGVGVDEEGYEKQMARQRARGEASWGKDTGDGDGAGAGRGTILEVAARETGELIAGSKLAGLMADDEGAVSEALEQARMADLKSDFLDHLRADRSTNLKGRSGVLLTMTAEGAAGPLDSGDRGAIVTWWSPFYPEGGGQVGDRGVIRGSAGAEFEVEDTQKLAGDPSLPPIHFGRVVRGRFQPKDNVEMEIRPEHRIPVRAHHTVTHLMHAALRNRLGAHVKQQGSLVEPTRLRFDFSHFQPVTAAELRRIENEVNEIIFRNLRAVHEEMSYTDAMTAGALAFFGEKYGQRVKVLSIGDYSRELCGGTHVKATGEIGLFRFTREEGIAAGVRRVEGLSHSAALADAQRQEDLLRSSAELLKSTPDALPSRIEKMLEDQKRLLKELESLRGRLASAGAGDLLARARDVAGVKVIAAEVDVSDGNALREYVETLREKLGSGVVVLGTRTADGKAALVAGVTRDLVSRIKAGELIKALAPVIGGRGGGKPDIAQGGGPDKDKLGAALERTYELIRR